MQHSVHGLRGEKGVRPGPEGSLLLSLRPLDPP